jgi:hypothetical protein
MSSTSVAKIPERGMDRVVTSGGEGIVAARPGLSGSDANISARNMRLTEVPLIAMYLNPMVSRELFDERLKAISPNFGTGQNGA